MGSGSQVRAWVQTRHPVSQLQTPFSSAITANYQCHGVRPRFWGWGLGGGWVRD